MKITFKTLKGEQFQVEIEPTQTIFNLKECVQQQKGLEIDTIKLVHKGKQHPDEKTIQECNIQEGEFIVITTTKKPNQPQQQPQQQAQQPVSNTNVNIPQTSQQPSQQTQAQNRQPTNTNQEQGNSLVLGEEHRQNVEMIVAMGFEKEKVELALRAAYMNPDRAIEYLINNNIPSFDQQDPNSSEEQEGDFGEEGDLPEQLEALANQPMFVRLREAISQNPAMLQPIMQNIQEESPEIFQLIQSYPQLLLGTGQQGGGGQQQQQQQQARNANRIMITQEDKEAIERIHSLGFSKPDSLEAYLACGRDENMAVNLLLEKQEKGDLYSQEEDQALIQQAIQQSTLQQQQQQPPQNQGNQSGSSNNNSSNSSSNNNNNNNNNNGGNNNNNNNSGGSDNIFD